MRYKKGLPKRSGESDGWGARLNNRKLRTGSGPAPPAQLPLTAESQEIAQRRHQTSEPRTLPQHTFAGQQDRDRQGGGELRRRRRMEQVQMGLFPEHKFRLKLLV